MTRAEFIKKFAGIFGIAIAAPAIIAAIPKETDPKLDGYNVPRKSLNGLQVYDPKDWSGLTSENHLGSLIDQMKPYHQQYNMTMIKLLSKFGA